MMNASHAFDGIQIFFVQTIALSKFDDHLNKIVRSNFPISEALSMCVLSLDVLIYFLMLWFACVVAFLVNVHLRAAISNSKYSILSSMQRITKFANRVYYIAIGPKHITPTTKVLQTTWIIFSCCRA